MRSVTRGGGRYVPLGVQLVGSVPLPGPRRVFEELSTRLGDRVRRLPDGETDARSDWIIWQYPVLSTQQAFEVAPPAPGAYRALPRLQLRPDSTAADLQLGPLGYAEAAAGSYRIFAVLKRDGIVPRACRFQVSLPTPLAPVVAFVSERDQPAVEAVYAGAMKTELERLLATIPSDQLAIQWDANVEVGMLAGDVSAWFDDPQEAIVERLAALGALVPADVELGYHFCLGHGEQNERHELADAAPLVALASAVAARLERPLQWLHLAAARDRSPESFLAPLGELRLPPETELYLGLLHAAERIDETERRIGAAGAAFDGDFGLSTPCGWGRFPAEAIDGLIEAHRLLSRPVPDPPGTRGYSFAWPGGFARIPDEDWVEQPIDAFGLHYDTVENHGWYRNLDLTVEQLAGSLREGEILLDYSGGTGILLDRLRLRIFDRQIGMLVVDSSPKFLRVALERFRGDERVAFRRLRYLKEERRLQYVDEVLGRALVERGVDVIVSTNAIHLYDQLEETLRAWGRVLRPGGTVRINSGNLRNPRAAESEWIIDETVYVVHEVATGLVRTDPRWARYREVLDDPERMRAYLDYRDRVFLAPRPLEYYLDTLRVAGFEIEEVTERTIEANVEEWFGFLAAYADAVLGWIGGSAKVDGLAADPDAAADRLAVLRDALELTFGGRPTFRCCWTYVTARRPSGPPRLTFVSEHDPRS